MEHSKSSNSTIATFACSLGLSIEVSLNGVAFVAGIAIWAATGKVDVSARARAIRRVVPSILWLSKLSTSKDAYINECCPSPLKKGSPQSIMTTGAVVGERLTLHLRIVLDIARLMIRHFVVTEGVACSRMNPPASVESDAKQA